MSTTKPDIRALALVGAKVRRDELKTLLAEAEQVVRDLQQVGTVKHNSKPVKKRRRHAAAFKAAVVKSTKEGMTVIQAAKKHKVSPSQVYKWMTTALNVVKR